MNYKDIKEIEKEIFCNLIKKIRKSIEFEIEREEHWNKWWSKENQKGYIEGQKSILQMLN